MGCPGSGTPITAHHSPTLLEYRARTAGSLGRGSRPRPPPLESAPTSAPTAQPAAVDSALGASDHDDIPGLRRVVQAMIDAQDKKEEAAELAAQRARVSPTLPAYDSLLFHQLVLDNSPDPRRSQRLVDRL
ncbi:hypothetical protein H4R21_000648, partial [Coemansia helicoidea]